MLRILRLGGVIAGVILIAFGIGSIVLGMNARDTVSTELSRENIVGTPDMNPADTKTALEEAKLTDVSAPSCNVAGKPINSGDEARCFASYMRIHALESSGGLTYAEMGRFALASNPADPKGTNDTEMAASFSPRQPAGPSASAISRRWLG